MKKKLSQQRQPSDPWKVFNHATRFVMAEEHLRRTKDVRLLNAFGPPSMVMSAFAIELLLKSLHLIEGQEPPETHHLLKLFRTLPHKRKQQIQMLWEQGALKRDRHLTQVETAIREDPAMKDFAIPRDLVSGLRLCADAFEKLRYSYEPTSKARYHLDDLPRILIALVYELRPDFKSPRKAV